MKPVWWSARSNQSILKEIGPESSLEGLMLRLKLQYFGHLMWRTNSLENALLLGKIKDWRRRGQQRMKWWDGITDALDMSLSKLRELVKDREALGCCSPWGHKESDMTERLNWTELYVNNINTCIRKNRKRQWHPTPVLLPGKSHGQRSLVGCSPWGH